MNYKNKQLCKIRTITVFLSLHADKKQWQEEISKASSFLSHASKQFLDSGYIVQSIRIVTNAFGEYINTQTLDSAKDDLLFLSKLLKTLQKDDIRVRFAIGEAKTHHEISMLPELIKEFGDFCNACVNISADDLGVLNNDLITQSAKAILKISQITPKGEGNFNFTVNCNCKPLIPYFPASYHQAELGSQFVIGLESPDLLVHVLEKLNKQNPNFDNHNDKLNQYFNKMSAALQYHASTIQEIVVNTNMEKIYKFSGFDSSAAPSKSCSSMTKVYEQMGVEYFGASGTIEASSLLTKVFQSLKDVNLVGFSGLMLALTEDMGLARGSIKKQFDIRSLLAFSAVCGIGLDTVPIPGDTSLEKISALIRDTGTMAYRLNKPLTVRLFPTPGLKAGDITSFESDDLCNCAVLTVP